MFCAQLAATGDVNTFARCTRGQVVLPASQQALVQCAELSTDTSGFAHCYGALTLAKSLNEDQQAALLCAERWRGAVIEYGLCMGQRAKGGVKFTQDQNTAIVCARRSSGDSEAFATCAGMGIIGSRLSREQKEVINCAVQSDGDPTGFATCAGAQVLNAQLNSEQQIAVQCVVESGGQPYAAAACTASRLTLRELQKCSEGIGGNGCFGDNNELVGRNGWTVRTFGNALNDIEHGAGPNNDLFGGQGVAGQALEEVRNNAPPAMQFGTVAGHRVCVPWC
jgi:hypothetical protein